MAAPRIKSVKMGDRTRYRFVADVGRDPMTGKRLQKTHTFDRKKDAQAALAEILSKVNRNEYAAPSKVTVDEHLTTWMRSATRGKEAATARNYDHATKPVRARLGAVPLQRLRTEHVEDLVDWMLNEGRRRGGQVGTGLSPARFSSPCRCCAPRSTTPCTAGWCPTTWRPR